MPSTVRLKLKSGGAVDPDSGLQNTAHIYQNGKDKYTAVLGLTDIQKQKNSYYNLQILESDYSKRYWLFRSWGRIGTTVGGNILQEMGLKDAKQEFCQLFKEKSGNSWNDRDNFVKLPGLMYPIDVDYGEEEAELKLHAVSDVPSKLAKPVQELIELIFDINEMNKVMLEFELDAEKMPLGKIPNYVIHELIISLNFQILDLSLMIFKLLLDIQCVSNSRLIADILETMRDMKLVKLKKSCLFQRSIY